jgi:pimeloyl-ACP methyl ester carboxylesterase
VTTARGLHPDRENDPVLLERLRAMQRRLGREVRARQAALVRRDGYADLERIACPSLVVACRQDRLRSLAESERMAQHLPHARFAILDDCGHMAPLERPLELTALLASWIEEARL